MCPLMHKSQVWGEMIRNECGGKIRMYLRINHQKFVMWTEINQDKEC